MNCRGRPVDSVWEHLKKINEGNQISAKRKECGHTLTSKVDRK